MALHRDTDPLGSGRLRGRSGRRRATRDEKESTSARRRRLLCAFRENDEVEARDRLVADCLPLIASLARGYATQGEHVDDLIQVGSIGLLKAIDRFEFDRGTEFTAYAIPVIVGEIRHHLRDNVRLVQIPRSVRELYSRLYREREELTLTLGRAPTTLELGAAVGMTENEVAEALEVRYAFQPASLSAVSGAHDETEVTLVDMLGGDDPAFEAAENRLVLAARFRRLAPRERRILHLRYHQDLTQSRIAIELGLTQMHVSRLIRGALLTLTSEAEPAA